MIQKGSQWINLKNYIFVLFPEQMSQPWPEYWHEQNNCHGNGGKAECAFQSRREHKNHLRSYEALVHKEVSNISKRIRTTAFKVWEWRRQWRPPSSLPYWADPVTNPSGPGTRTDAAPGVPPPRHARNSRDGQGTCTLAGRTTHCGHVS